ncbi:D-alanyl-D-alanine carboxypeptidase [Streptomyces sp. NPDC057238]|uniref:D-alanyl-D-alanine carboxypeptidase n=1 Tax=Streptomyces sp. NPDC057238 TaxID=3346060 RepID=UPI00363C0165
MAGESPDRSKQRESSAEPTSGSADPVPEKRDPRLAVSREAEPSESRGSIDTATRVLSTPSGAGEESGRLREAVAAWVRSADPDESEGGAEGATTDTENSSDRTAAVGDRKNTPEAGTTTSTIADQGEHETEPESGHTDDASGEAENASERTAAVGDRKNTPEAGTTTSTIADQGEHETEPGSGRTDDASGEAEGTPERTAATTKSKGGAEDAADVSHGQDGSEAPRAGDEPESAAHAAAGTGTGAPKPTVDVSRGQDGSESSGTDADAPRAAGDAPRAEKKPEDAGTDTDAPEAVAFAGDEDGSEGTGKGADGSEGTAQDVPGAGAAKTAALAGPGEGEPEAGSSGGGDGKPVAGAQGATEDDRHGEDEPGGGPSAADAAEDGRPKAEGPVDQPTAVFRTGRPSAPAVDQPTTMLKLGAAVREAAAEAERTSKFVALKRDDDLGGHKPPAAPAAPAGATSSLPQVGPERTTQQPLPPRPPLDLLAELTNTPPPPQTPLRTAVRRVKIWAPLVVLLAIVFAIVQTVRPLPTPTLVLTAENTHTFDGDQVKLPWPDEGQGWMSGDGIGTMDHFGEQKPVAIGSVAKTMTAYIILREHPLKPGEEGPKIEVDAKAEEEGGYDKDGESTLNTVKAGDFLTEKQALSAVMVPSANNIARLLARWDAGSEEAFVEKMNDTAKELGMTNTTYTDPSGLKATTVSTAEDQTKLGVAAMRIPAMVAITSAASWTDPTGKYWTNYNELPYTMGAIGIKTGSTTKAGGNLLFAGRKEVDGQTVIVVGAILGQHKGPSILKTVNEVSKPALRAAQEALTSAKILKKGDVVGYVDDGLGGRTPVTVTEDVKAVGWAGLSVKLTFTGDDLPHTAKTGTKVGTLTVGDGSGGAVKVPVALQEDLAEPGFTDKLTRLS